MAGRRMDGRQEVVPLLGQPGHRVRDAVGQRRQVLPGQQPQRAGLKRQAERIAIAGRDRVVRMAVCARQRDGR